ncbi:MAG: RsmE family RNA methyltransferase [Puniceicoccales bacterium]|jgi:RsmE family RNA methyltransferase|nr:RsmE family RNA methyltransferase [Puniceicoccales bacterium]
MNLILLKPDEANNGGLPGADVRAVHIRDVLRAKAGDTVCVGVASGQRGTALLLGISTAQISWEIAWEKTTPSPFPLRLLVGLPRPQTARKILLECASLGFAEIHFFNAEKGDPAYAQSSLWHGGETKDLLHKAAAQAFTTLVPILARHASLDEALQRVAPAATEGNTRRVFLDIYEAGEALDKTLYAASSILIAIGPERGWSATERNTLRGAGFAGAHMGEHVLRVETACVAAGAIALAALGQWQRHGTR